MLDVFDYTILGPTAQQVCKRRPADEELLAVVEAAIDGRGKPTEARKAGRREAGILWAAAAMMIVSAVGMTSVVPTSAPPVRKRSPLQLVALPVALQLRVLVPPGATSDRLAEMSTTTGGPTMTVTSAVSTAFPAPLQVRM